MISSISLNVRLANNKTQIFPLYTSKGDFNRAKNWMNIRRPFTVQGKEYRVYMRTYQHTFINDAGGQLCTSRYSTTTSTTQGLFVWIQRPSVGITDRRIEITGWVPKTETVYPNLEARSSIVPIGFPARVDRVYLISNGTARIFNNSVYGAPLPSIKFYRGDGGGTYDLLTYRGNYIINTRGGETTMYFPGETNTSGGNTIYYDLSKVYKTDYSWTDSATNPKHMEDGGYYEIDAPYNSSTYTITVNAGEKTYNTLYLPLVEEPGSVSARAGLNNKTLYFNESFVTTCEAAKDYGGSINCPNYGLDCTSETNTDNILVNTFTCEAGENITYDLCDNDTCSSDSSKVTKVITRCESAACLTQTNMEANIDPNCTVQGENKAGDASSLPTDLPEIDSWIDPNACNTQTNGNESCEIDGANSVTCLGRVDTTCGEPMEDKNKIGDYYIWDDPDGGTIYVDNTCDSLIYCTEKTNTKDNGKIQYYCKLVQEYIDTSTDYTNTPCSGVTYKLDCESQSYMRQTPLPDGGTETFFITNERIDPESDLVEIITIRQYKDGSMSTTTKFVTEDGTLVGVSTRDRDGNTFYCVSDSCTSDATKKEYFDHPEKTVACEALRQTVQQTITTGTDGEPPSSDKEKPVIQNICNSLTTTVSDGHGGTINITITDQGTLVNADTGEVIPTQQTETSCAGGQTQISITTGDGSCPTYSQETISYPDGSYIITNTSTDPTCGQTRTTTTAARTDGTKIEQDWSGTIWITVPGESTPVEGTCWSGASSCPGYSGAKICGGGNDQSTGSCTVGAG